MSLITPPRPSQGDKENGVFGLDVPSSETSIKTQRVVFSDEHNKTHILTAILPLNPTPAPDSEPSKPILKKRTYADFLADNFDFPIDPPERASTPEPESPHEDEKWLLRPLKALVSSVTPDAFDDSESCDKNNLRGLIEAYCVLTARLKANLLPSDNRKELDENVVQPAMEPIKHYLEHLTTALRRDILRAKDDPIQSCARLDKKSPVVRNIQLPSPPPSSPSQIASSSPVKSDDSQESKGTPKKGGMNEQQVKHARDLCTVAQSAMKLFSSLICFTKLIHADVLFTESQLTSLVEAVVAIPLASPLPTPNSRKTCSLAVTIIASFASLPLSVVAPHASDIASVFKRGINGELGREGKKGSITDALRGVMMYCTEFPQQFGPPFGLLLPSLLKLVQTSGNSQTQAGYALASLASASVEIPSSIPSVSKVLSEFLSLKNRKKDEMPAIFVGALKSFQTAISTGNTEVGSTVNGKQITSQLQAACQTAALWNLTVLSSVIVLASGNIWKDGTAITALAKILRTLLSSKRVSVRTSASWGWRAFTWSAFKYFDETDVEHGDARMSAMRKTFDFLEKGIGIGVVAGLLVGSDGKEDREQRIELTIQALLDIARKRATAEDAIAILERLLSDEEYVEADGPSMSWDFNKLLAAPLLDGTLSESDSKALTNLVKSQQESEKEWIQDVPPLMRLEVQDRLEDLYEIWQSTIKSYGVDDKGYPMPFVAEIWPLLLKRSKLIPEARVMSFITEPPHTWTNLAAPSQTRQHQTAHQIVQARYVKMLWLGLIKRYGPIPELQKLALEMYDAALQVFDLSEGKVEDVCLEMFYFLAEVESKIVVLMMGHEDWSDEMKRTFWGKACVAARDEELLRALVLAPFGEPAPFELEEDDWKIWEQAWDKYIGERGDSVKGRALLQSLFVEELSYSLPPFLSAHITGYLLATFPAPIMPSDDRETVLKYIDHSISLAYRTNIRAAVEVSITNLHWLTEVLSHLNPSHLPILAPSLIQWISDEDNIMDDKEYDIIVGQTYGAVLDCLARDVVDGELLTAHRDLLSCITKRVTKGLKTMHLFGRFWKAHCAHVDQEDIPKEICTLLLVMGSHEAQEDLDNEEGEEELPVKELPSDESCGVDEVNELLATADALDEQEQEEEDLSSPTAEEVAIESPEISPVRRSSSHSVPVEELQVSDRHAQVNTSNTSNADFNAAFSFAPEHKAAFGLSPCGSPGSRKRRSLDEDEEECAPVKRRRQDDDDDDDSTPVKPWFGEEEEERSSDASIAFEPFTADNLPKRAYQFSATPEHVAPRSCTSAPRGVLFPVLPLPTPAHRSLIKPLSTPSHVSVHSAPLYIDSSDAQNGNPSAKRRRIGGEPSFDELPPSDEPEPCSDDSQLDSIPSSDDSVPGHFSPDSILSPLMASSGEPGSDDSNESPLKTHLERKRRLLEARIRSSDSSSSLDGNGMPTSIRSLVDLEARSAMTRAGLLVTSMDKSGLMHFSSLLEQMRAKVDDELKRKAES